MVDFRRFITALAVLAVFVGLASAQVVGSAGGQLTCATNVTATPQLRSEGYTEATGDITITCTGGPTLAVGSAIPQVNITIFLNTQVTSRLLGSSNQSEALLLIDEPGSSTLGSAAGGNQPFGPLAPQTVCTTFSSGCPEVVSSLMPTTGAFVGTAVNVATNNAQGTTASVNGYNVFQGVVSANSVTWFGVPVLAPGTVGISRTFRFTNIRANASALSGGSAAGATPVIASIAVSNTAALPISNPTPTVGFVEQSLSTAAASAKALQQCNNQTRTFVSTLTFSELFGSAFKTRVVPVVNTQWAGQSSSSPGAGGSATATQNIPGTVYNSESNFIQNGVTGNGWTAGLADFGTRLKATFNNIPTGMRIFVSINNVKNGNAGVTALANPLGNNDMVTSSASLINSETSADGNAGSTFFPSISASTNATDSNGGNIPAAELAVTNGSAVAVWEVVNTNPNANETFRFGVFTTYTANVSQNSPPAGTATVNLSYAPTPPVFTTSSGAAASGSLNIPRFIQDPNAAKNIFTVNVCRTVLLYPFVTEQAGFDTGLAIANTSTDPFGTAPQAGSCTLNWYSGTASPAPTNTGNIASGTVYTGLASVLVPGFQGYMIAVCQFQYAHGFAFISDLGARNLAMGYLVIVIPDPATAGNNRNADPLSTAVAGSGENSAH